MLVRAVFLLLALAIPLQASAAGYVVRPGDTLGAIAQRYHVSVLALARANHIGNINVIQVGRLLIIPVPRRIFYYRVRWGDTLLGIAARYGLDIPTIRSMNQSLGPYPLAGEWLRLCSPCSAEAAVFVRPTSSPSAPSGVPYVVQPGDTLLGIAARYGVAPGALLVANRLLDPDLIVIGTRLTIPEGWAIPYDPWLARSTIVDYANRYGIEPPLPLAVGWQESGFNQNLVSPTGAIGVMQVEPYTGRHIAALMGHPLNLHRLDDNIHAGVFWLSDLISYYGGDERLAVAAYYQGTKALARHGLYEDTLQYVNDVLSLKSSFGG